MKNLFNIDLKYRLKNPLFIFGLMCFGLLLMHAFNISPEFLSDLSYNIASAVSSITLIIGSVGGLAAVVSDWK